MRTQVTVWTALPNGVARNGSVNLSVFVSPQLQTNEGGAHPTLALFPDFVTWPHTVTTPKITFSVTFAGHPAVHVAPSPTLSNPRWVDLFDPHKTGVTSYVYEDFSSTPIHTYDAKGVAEQVAGLYGAIGVASPRTPPVLTTLRGRFAGPGNDPAIETIYTGIQNIDEGGNRTFGGSRSAIGEVIDYYTRPSLPLHPTPTPFAASIPTLDFHQAVSSLGSYPAVLRDLGLVFDLVVPLPHGLAAGTVEVSVVPTFTSAFSGPTAAANHWTNVVVSPVTSATLSKVEFRALPAGPDYGNGMLDLADATRFSVIDLDLDGAAEQLSNLSTALGNISAWVEPQEADGQTLAMTVPTLRSTGPAIVWSGWAGAGNGLNALAARQTTIANAVTSFVDWVVAPPPKGPAPVIPVLVAEDIIRGHRFDVLSLSEPGSPWRSLHQRVGRYVFGTGPAVGLPTAADSTDGRAGHDEGTSVPGATTAAGVPSPPPDLYVNEAIARWAGWSLAAPRPGPQIDPDDTVGPNPQNPAVTTPDANGQVTAQLSASFTAAPGTLPKLRFGRAYRYRARAVDLAGNSLPVGVTDATTATVPVRHLRYEPVLSPMMAQTAPLGPGEATLLLPILNYQTTPATPVAPNGRWLFPPKASELLAEEHGMLDGFALGQPPNHLERPNPNNATFKMLAGANGVTGRVDATFADVTLGVTDPSGGTYIAPTGDPTTPWLPDPLARGVTLDGFPGAVTPTIRVWENGPWPNASPMLLLLEAGAAVTHAFAPGTADKPAVEFVTLPPADVLDLSISSALTPQALETLGVFAWMEAEEPTALRKLELALLGERGQLWMISPYRVLRLVHAVRLPLVLPSIATPVVAREFGSTQAMITDAAYVLDAKSTADIDVEAFWTDPLDDPSDPTNDPATDTVTSQAHAFKMNVPDPGPLPATAKPMEVFEPPSELPISGYPGVTHNLGDTLHHLVDYTATASSRFAEFFSVTEMVTFSGVTPLEIDLLGLDPTSVTLVDLSPSPPGPPVTLTQSPDGTTGDYIVDGEHGTITMLSETAYSGTPLQITYLPPHTVTGIPFPVEIPSSASPKVPKIVKVTPAWATIGPDGAVATGKSLARVGGFIRIYLDRPWWSTGAGELLGVVGIDTGQLDGATGLPDGVDPTQVTLMGLDPISVSSLTQTFPIVPTSFGATTTVPWVPYRPAYASPPELPVSPGGPDMQIWPYKVEFDPVSGYWYADVHLTAASSIDGPPPGYFVRLALVRFQPYSIEGAELSPVALATFAQPVPDRAVSVTQVTSDPTATSVNVEVIGTGYYGWRPPQSAAGRPDVVQIDNDNIYAEHPFSPVAPGAKASSTMVVEIQVRDTSSGLSGELAWVLAPGLAPVILEDQSFNGEGEVTWSHRSVGGGPAPIALPFAIGSPNPMRVRISELDYYPFGGNNSGEAPIVPAEVNTTFRRPFVAFIPIN